MTPGFAVSFAGVKRETRRIILPHEPMIAMLLGTIYATLCVRAGWADLGSWIALALLAVAGSSLVACIAHPTDLWWRIRLLSHILILNSLYFFLRIIQPKLGTMRAGAMLNGWDVALLG